MTEWYDINLTQSRLGVVSEGQVASINRRLLTYINYICCFS